jgi:predicted metal-binding protein
LLRPIGESKPMEKIIKQLQSEAIQLGTTQAKVIPISSIVVDERVRLKCLIPLCNKYNQNLMCPPNLPSVEEFRKSLKKYSKALFVQLAFEKKEKVSKTEMQRYGLWLHKIIHQLERKALSLGYSLAAGLIGGSCKLCRKCVGPHHPCRHPLMARPSIEGMGINVIQTAKKIGLPFDFSSQNRLFWNGLLLID